MNAQKKKTWLSNPVSTICLLSIVCPHKHANMHEPRSHQLTGDDCSHCIIMRVIKQTIIACLHLKWHRFLGTNFYFLKYCIKIWCVLTLDPAGLLLVTYPREMKTCSHKHAYGNVHSSSTQNSPRVETAKMVLSWWMNRQWKPIWWQKGLRRW